MPKGFPIGFEMAEKNGNKQADKHFRIYISRDYFKKAFMYSFRRKNRRYYMYNVRHN